MSNRPIPKNSFLDRCEPLGYIHGERRWRGKGGRLYTWDALHGKIEVFDRLGHHRGVIDVMTGTEIKPARKGRRIRV